jgi:hypothetical protein
MAIGTTAAILIGAGLGSQAAGTIASARAAKNVGEQQAQSAERAAQMQYGLGQQAIDVQRQQFQQAQQLMQPYVQNGLSAQGAIASQLGLPSSPQGGGTLASLGMGGMNPARPFPNAPPAAGSGMPPAGMLPTGRPPSRQATPYMSGTLATLGGLPRRR